MRCWTSWGSSTIRPAGRSGRRTRRPTCRRSRRGCGAWTRCCGRWWRGGRTRGRGGRPSTTTGRSSRRTSARPRWPTRARGYQPLVAVWAEEQLIEADAFRDGNVAGGEDPLSSVQRAMGNLPGWVRERYFRGDSASYYRPLLQYLVGEGIGFTISADLTQELRTRCQAVPEGDWVELETRARERVDLAELAFTPGDWPKSAAPLRYLAVRFTPRQAELFEGTPKYLAIVSNRAGVAAGPLVRWHWEKAGTIEHVHRVMKDELGAGVMPSGRFGANAAWFRINALTFNVLTVLKRRALPARLREARPKRLRFELFTLPGKLRVHQSRLAVRTSLGAARLEEIGEARSHLLALLEARAAG